MTAGFLFPHPGTISSALGSVDGRLGWGTKGKPAVHSGRGRGLSQFRSGYYPYSRKATAAGCPLTPGGRFTEKPAPSSAGYRNGLQQDLKARRACRADKALERFYQRQHIQDEEERRYYADLAVAALERGAVDADDILADLGILAYTQPFFHKKR